MCTPKHTLRLPMQFRFLTNTGRDKLTSHQCTPGPDSVTWEYFRIDKIFGVKLVVYHVLVVNHILSFYKFAFLKRSVQNVVWNDWRRDERALACDINVKERLLICHVMWHFPFLVNFIYLFTTDFFDIALIFWWNQTQLMERSRLCYFSRFYRIIYKVAKFFGVPILKIEK